jgi:hypothetical protein
MAPTTRSKICCLTNKAMGCLTHTTRDASSPGSMSPASTHPDHPAAGETLTGINALGTGHQHEVGHAGRRGGMPRPRAVPDA